MQTFTGREYLKIDIANNYGMSKDSWAVRINWFDANEPHLESLLKQAEEPALYYAGVKAYRDVIAGKPIGYMISLDATSSGIQLLAALTCDPYAAAICNVVNTGHRQDAYKAIYQSMLKQVGQTAKLDPKEVKQAVMTAFYASKAMPKKVFGEGALLDTFYSTLQSMAPAAWDLNETMLALWDPTKLEHSWVLPDNFHVRIKVMNQVRERVHFDGEPFDVFYNVNMPTEEGRSLGANTIHSIDGMIVREMTRRCDYDPKKISELSLMLEDRSSHGFRADTVNDKLVLTLWEQYAKTGYLSARILDHLESANAGHVKASAVLDLINSMPARPFKVISIHDCFRCLPHYGNDLRRQYNLQLQLIAQSNLLQSIISQLVGKPVKIGKLDPSLPSQIMDTDYALS